MDGDYGDWPKTAIEGHPHLAATAGGRRAEIEPKCSKIHGSWDPFHRTKKASFGMSPVENSGSEFPTVAAGQ